MRGARAGEASSSGYPLPPQWQHCVRTAGCVFNSFTPGGEGGESVAASEGVRHCERPEQASAMYLMFYLDEEGNRVYTLAVQT